MDYVEHYEGDYIHLERKISEYYLTQWSSIRADIESRFGDYHIDDEAKDTFREALSAHEHKNYRCFCRVLFPEIERMIRLNLFNDAGRVRTSEMLRKLTDERPLEDFISQEAFGLVLFGRLVKHLYEGDYIEKYPAARSAGGGGGIVRTSTGSSTHWAASSRVMSGLLVVCENGSDAPVTCHRGCGNFRYNPLYEQVNDEERGKFEQNFVPNRHTAMHGLASYSTHKHSMNMIIMADYIFQILPPPSANALSSTSEMDAEGNGY